MSLNKEKARVVFDMFPSVLETAKRVITEPSTAQTSRLTFLKNLVQDGFQDWWDSIVCGSPDDYDKRERQLIYLWKYKTEQEILRYILNGAAQEDYVFEFA